MRESNAKASPACTAPEAATCRPNVPSAPIASAAALRACELDVDVLMKATKVDGVYDSDPKKNPDAKRYDRVSYMEVLSKGLNVMDSTATSLCMDNDVPMIVFDLTVKGNISRALKGEDVGTTVESQ